MFTGLVQDLGTVTVVDATHDGVRLSVRTKLAGEIGEGDSVAVNGVCLTATAIADGEFRADVMHETLRRSSLGEAIAGSDVNLELSLRAADRMGGHIVQGHVDGLASVRDVREDGFSRVVTFAAPPELGSPAGPGRLRRLRYVRLARARARRPGGSSEGSPPVPIPNTAVKPFSADGTSSQDAGE